MTSTIVRCIIAATILVFSSCSIEPKSEPITHSIVYMDYQDILVESLPKYKSLRFIPLETRADALIGRIDKIVCTPNHYIILDRNKSKSVYLFNKDGSLFKTISTMGRGPMEYASLSDIGFDPYNLELVIVDSKLRKIIRYDQGGKFIDEEFFNFRPFNIGFVDKNTYAIKTMSSEAEPYILTIDHDGSNPQNVHDIAFEFNIHWTYYFQSGPSGQLYYENLKDTIWRIYKDKATPLLTLNYGDRGMDESEFKNLKDMGKRTRSIASLPKDRSGDIRKIFETENYIQISYKNLGDPALVLVDKKNYQPINQMNYIKDNERPWGVLYYLLFCTDKADTFIGHAPASLYLDIINSNSFKELLPEGEISIETKGFQGQDQITISSNHVITVFEL